MTTHRFGNVKINILFKKIFLLILFTSGIYSQSIHHQMLFTQGKSIILINEMLVSQTIGQQSAIANHTNGVTFGQGFQQSNWANFMNSNTSVNIETTIYPNPFITTLNFKFSQPISEIIEIALFDGLGRLIPQDKKRATDSVLTIEPPQLDLSNYLVRLTAANCTYYSQILKKHEKNSLFCKYNIYNI